MATLYPDWYAGCGFLQTARERVEGLEQVRAYYEREGAVRWPFVTQSMAAVEIRGD